MKRVFFLIIGLSSIERWALYCMKGKIMVRVNKYLASCMKGMIIIIVVSNKNRHLN